MIIFIFAFALYICFWLVIFILEATVKGGLDLIWQYQPFDIFILALNLSHILIWPILVSFLAAHLFKTKFFRKFGLFFLSVVATLFYISHLFLLIYHLRNGVTFTWTYFWLNRSEVFLTLFRIFPVYAFLILLI